MKRCLFCFLGGVVVAFLFHLVYHPAAVVKVVTVPVEKEGIPVESDELSQKELHDKSLMFFRQKLQSKTLDWVGNNLSEKGFSPKSPKSSVQGLSLKSKTALALLQLLSEGKTHTDAKYGDNIEDAISFLTLDGHKTLEYDVVPESGTYENTFLTLYYSELYGMTGMNFLKPITKPYLKSLLETQQDDGGWALKGQSQSSISLTYWQVNALVSANNYKFKFVDLKPVITKTTKFLLSKLDETGITTEHVYYITRDSLVNGLAVVHALQLLGKNEEPKVLIAIKNLTLLLQKLSPKQFDKEYNSPKIFKEQHLYIYALIDHVLFLNRDSKSYQLFHTKFVPPMIIGKQQGMLSVDGPDGYWESDVVDPVDLSLFSYTIFNIGRNYRNLPMVKIQYGEDINEKLSKKSKAN